MAEITDLKELYVDELKDLWSANDQMARALKKITPKATDKKLKDMLAKSQEGIAGHTELLKSLIEGQEDKVTKEHCKGMEGLAAEAIKHTIEEPPEKGPALDGGDNHAIPANDTLWHRWIWYGCSFCEGDEADRRLEKAEGRDKGPVQWR